MKKPLWKGSSNLVGQENFGAKTQAKTSQDFGTKT